VARGRWVHGLSCERGNHFAYGFALSSSHFFRGGQDIVVNGKSGAHGSSSGKHHASIIIHQIERACRTSIQVKTLHQTFGPEGNPTATNLFNIIACLPEHEGVRLQVVA
jgi:hypothetical protein